jgi:hypothetical protein
MGLITMSERDVQRIEVLSKVIDGRATLVSAARVLALSERQVRRLLERIRTNGAASIRHKAIGRPTVTCEGSSGRRAKTERKGVGKKQGAIYFFGELSLFHPLGLEGIEDHWHRST